jgi:broad specificity phosphatase PhoE
MFISRLFILYFMQFRKPVCVSIPVVFSDFVHLIQYGGILSFNMAKRVIIIRHGESMGNIGMRTENATAIPLSSQGVLQAEALVDQILERPEAIIFSPYIRTQLTAAPLLKKFPDISPEEWHSIREFTYLSNEKYDNTTQDERAVPKEVFWQRNDPRYRDGGASESFADFIERTEEALERIRNHRARTLILFSHEQFIQMLLFMHEHLSLFDEYKQSSEGMKELMRLYKQKVDASRILNATPIDISYMFDTQ